MVSALVPCHESHFSPASFWWWTHECWPKPRRKKAADCWMLKRGFFLTSCMIFILYSWRDFGRTTTSWKIHYCLTVSLLVQHAFGWDSVEPWSFWNDSGNFSRLTGVNIVSLKILRDCIWSWHDMVLKPVRYRLHFYDKCQVFWAV